MKSLVHGRGALTLAVVVVLLAFFTTVAPASAASLTIVGKTRAYAMTTARCTNGPLTVVPTGTPNSAGQYTSVRVTGISGTGCTTGRVIVYRSTTPRTVLFSANGTVSAGALTASSTAFTPPASSDASVYVTINGWAVPAVWSFTPVLPLVSCTVPSDPTATCTAVLDGTPDTWGGPPNTDYNVYFKVSSSSPTTTVRWQITINLAHATFPFVARSMNANNQSQLASGWTCAQLPTVTLTGQDGPSTALVGGGKEVRVYLNGHSTAAAGGNLYVCP